MSQVVGVSAGVGLGNQSGARGSGSAELGVLVARQNSSGWIFLLQMLFEHHLCDIVTLVAPCL